jgi:hypothetical protein
VLSSAAAAGVVVESSKTMKGECWGISRADQDITLVDDASSLEGTRCVDTAASASAVLSYLVLTPVSRAALSELMRDAIVKAGLPGKCNSHRLRKAMLRRLAEAGATEKQIAAWSGHKTLREIERYTRAADQKRLAQDAMKKR